MYTLNGYPAHNPTLGWTLTNATEFVTGTTLTRPEARVPGFDGGWEMDGVEDVPALSLTWVVDYDKIDGLRNVLRSPSLILGKGDEGRTAVVELSAYAPTRKGDSFDSAYEVKASLVIPGIWLRGPEVTETVALETDTKTCNLLAGMTGKVSDGLIVLTGPIATGVRVQDVGGLSWVKFNQPVPAGSSLRIDQTFGRAHMTTSGDGFTGGAEVTQHLETGPGPYSLRLTPTLSAADPSITQPKLRVTSTGRTDTSAISMRARPAYNL